MELRGSCWACQRPNETGPPNQPVRPVSRGLRPHHICSTAHQLQEIYSEQPSACAAARRNSYDVAAMMRKSLAKKL